MTGAPRFGVVSGTDVAAVLAGAEHEVMSVVREAYLAHYRGQDVLPHSSFLRFPERPEARVIALPAHVGGPDGGLTGIKWISSFPRNRDRGLPRASAVLVLNDPATGFPRAVLEGAGISAARTAASAALAAHTLGGAEPASVGVVGAGVIATRGCDFLAATGVPLRDLRCHDLDPAAAGALAGRLTARHGPIARVTSLAAALDADLVLLATTAATPYVPADVPLRPGQLLLNLSLRDLPAELLPAADNVVDDVEHCLRERTSPHLAELLTGGRDFLTGTLAEVLTGAVRLDPDRPTIFSPFGLGVLDLAVGAWVLARARATGRWLEVPGFFPDLTPTRDREAEPWS